MNGPNSLKTAADTPIRPLIRPFQEFAERETSGGIVLLLCTAIALLWVNSPWAESYEALWQTKVVLGFAGETLDHDLHFWVNDALMAALSRLMAATDTKQDRFRYRPWPRS